MQWLALLQLIPLLTNLIKTAEVVMGDGTGKKKKAFVVDAVEQVFIAMPNVSTGGQKETWTEVGTVMPAVKGLIDVIAGLFFPHKD